MKEYGQDLLKKYKSAKTALANAESKINKRFDLIMSDYQNYITEDDKNYLNFVSLSELDLNKKCEIIMRTEAEYVKVNSNQGELFKS